MGYDHYFVDGNGRTARVLQWVMLRENYSLVDSSSFEASALAYCQVCAIPFLEVEPRMRGDLTYF